MGSDEREKDSLVEELQAERRFLLEELEMAYLQMERVLAVSGHETQIAYEELRRKNEALQFRLDELESAHRQLQETQRMLLHAERMSAMGQMAATIVHEINGPLAVITGHAELMLMREVEEGQEASLNTILQAGWRLRDLAQNILHFSRQRHAERMAVDLNELVGEVVKFLAPLLKRADIRTELADELPIVTAAPSRLEQVLFNFCVNAIDAMEGQEERSLVVRTGVGRLAGLIAADEAVGWASRLALENEPGKEGGRWVYAEVRDNGPGIERSGMDEIFDAFFTTKGEGKGTGLGLAISRNIAEEHGGNIMVASKRDVGASFRLMLPVEADDRRSG